mmetsp:Transcript_14210/g.39619  ORF Transcript_14210/g.39619 Transcript_14210/m.39619 type:complete len:225 (-) Transcript_14210:350-1024(-)
MSCWVSRPNSAGGRFRGHQGGWCRQPQGGLAGDAREGREGPCCSSTGRACKNRFIFGGSRSCQRCEQAARGAARGTAGGGRSHGAGAAEQRDSREGHPCALSCHRRGTGLRAAPPGSAAAVEGVDLGQVFDERLAWSLHETCLGPRRLRCHGARAARQDLVSEGRRARKSRRGGRHSLPAAGGYGSRGKGTLGGIHRLAKFSGGGKGHGEGGGASGQRYRAERH